MPPVVVLFAFAVLVLAQVFHVLFPRRVTYLRRLLLALVGVTVGELLGSHLLSPGPRLGELHPLWDAGITTPLELLANRLSR